jgi:hypothetical protein
MSSIHKTIQKRTKKVRTEIQHEWHERWWQFILANPDKPWNWGWISKNPNITMKFILDNPDKPWNWSAISMNPNITMDFINDKPDKEWHWYDISSNPSITMKDIIDNPDKPWNWNAISRNTFSKDKEEFQMKRYREHLAAILIQNAYKNALVNPNCQLGINRIERDMKFAGVE